MAHPSPQSLLPLAPASFHILVSLADADRHGYALIQDIADRTSGTVRLGAGTLYRTIQRLLEDGLILETAEEDRPNPDEDDERRRYYRITAFGRAVARAEAERLADLVRLARACGLAPRRI